MLTLKLFVGSSLLPLVDHSLNFCRLEREMNRNIITKIYLSQNPIFLKVYNLLKPCPVERTSLILRNVTEKQEEVGVKVNLPGFDYPEITIRAFVSAKIVPLKRRENLISTMLVLEMIEDEDEKKKIKKL